MNDISQFYTILYISSIDHGSQKPLNQITNENTYLINSNKFFNLNINENIKLKIFNLEIPKSRSEYNPESFLNNILNIFKKVGKQNIDLIIVSIPLNRVRLDAFFIRQTFRILGRSCDNNIIALLTNLDLLSEEAKMEILDGIEESIHQSLKDNMVFIRTEDIKVYESNFVEFLVNKLEKIKKNGLNNFKIECIEKFNFHYQADKKEINAFLNLKSEDENFFNFVQDYKELDNYVSREIVELFKRDDSNGQIYQRKSVCCNFMKFCLNFCKKRKGYIFSFLIFLMLIAGDFYIRRYTSYYLN